MIHFTSCSAVSSFPAPPPPATCRTRPEAAAYSPLRRRRRLPPTPATASAQPSGRGPDMKFRGRSGVTSRPPATVAYHDYSCAASRRPRQSTLTAATRLPCCPCPAIWARPLLPMFHRRPHLLLPLRSQSAQLDYSSAAKTAVSGSAPRYHAGQPMVGAPTPRRFAAPSAPKSVRVGSVGRQTAQGRPPLFRAPSSRERRVPTCCS